MKLRNAWAPRARLLFQVEIEFAFDFLNELRVFVVVLQKLHEKKKASKFPLQLPRRAADRRILTIYSNFYMHAEDNNGLAM